MTAWATIRRVSSGVTVPLFFVLVIPALGHGADDTTDPHKPTKLTPAQWRASAEAAEKANDWEAAFTAYCHLFVAERNSPDLRERLNHALRRSQQVRRHRDPAFQQFAAGMSTLDAMRLFAEVLTKVPVLYVDRERATPQILWEHGIEELARALDNPLFRQVYLDSPAAAKADGFRNSLRSSWARQPVANANDARKLLPKLLDAADAAFASRIRAALVLEIVCGSCAGLDEYTVFLNPSQYNPTSVGAVPDLTAQGVYLWYADGGLVVAGIAPGSWAALEAPGLRKGDRVATLNGKTMAAATPALAAEALRTPVEGYHELEVIGEDAEAPAFVARLPVVVPTVFGTSVAAPKDSLPGKDGGIGYTRIGRVAATTPRELDEAIHGLKARGVRSLVIDLRGNMGGSFQAGVETAKRLIPAGLIVTTQGQTAQVDNQPFSSDSGMSAHDIPVVVLVDSETASAAELLAAALKDHRRATLVGMPTFGKGAVQYPVRLDALDEKDASGQPKTGRSGGVRLTIAKLLSPSGAAINGVGVTPHVLEMHPAQQLDLAFKKAVDLLPASPLPPAPMALPMIP
jgi:carboxyl-terminal processing protease